MAEHRFTVAREQKQGGEEALEGDPRELLPVGVYGGQGYATAHLQRATPARELCRSELFLLQEEPREPRELSEDAWPCAPPGPAGQRLSRPAPASASEGRAAP